MLFSVFVTGRMKGYLILTELECLVLGWHHLMFTLIDHLSKHMQWFGILIPYMKEKH